MKILNSMMFGDQKMENYGNKRPTMQLGVGEGVYHVLQSTIVCMLSSGSMGPINILNCKDLMTLVKLGTK